MFLALLGEDLAEHAGRSWASEDVVEARGIDHCDSAVGIVMAEVKKKETYNGIFRDCTYSCTSKFKKVVDCVARE